MKRVYSVLIAEDESEIRRALAAMVEEHPSFRVAGCAGDGKAALRMIEALRPDVLMTDIRMPYMDGLELLQALDARGIRIKTVIISGYSSFSYARTAMKYGASDYLLKPLLPAQCQQTLDLLEKALDLQAGSFSLDIALQKPSPLPQMQAEAYLLAACLGNYPFCAGDKGTDAAALRAYVKQSGLDVDSVFAGSRFNAQMGDLGDFSENAEYMYNLFRCMAKPHGTGVYFYYKGKRYNVGAMIPGNDLQLEDYLGIPGKVVNCADGAIWVKTRDNVVVLSELTDEDGENIPVEYFKIGNKFGK